MTPAPAVHPKKIQGGDARRTPNNITINMNALQPLGDQGALLYFTNEDQAARFAGRVRGLRDPWLVDVVQAYMSVAVFFDPAQTRFSRVAARLHALEQQADSADAAVVVGTLHRIPCCYELQLDLARVAEHTRLGADEIIRIHTATTYTVYAIGFCPGFPYLGYLPEPLQGAPRLATPRVCVEPGSVGLTGKQTGIYTEQRPGGWNLIGRTPLELVHVRDGYFPLRTGDQVVFERIDETEYRRRVGERL
jgi:inhibitor of KinA